MDDGEERGVGADPERQSENCDDGKAGVLAELPNTVAAIRHHRVEPIANPYFANLLLHLFDAAKFDPRGALRLLQRHARANVFVCQHLEV
ncbi:MAG: hypothetical protein WCC98_19330 [Candidatus Acidiferrales bacterium]